MDSEGETLGHVTAEWRQLLTQYYPDVLSTTHFVPPVYFNRLPYCKGTVPGTTQPALVLQHGTQDACGLSSPLSSGICPVTKTEAVGSRIPPVSTLYDTNSPIHCSPDSCSPKVLDPPVHSHGTGVSAAAIKKSAGGHDPTCRPAACSLWTSEVNSGEPVQDLPVQSSDIQEDFAQNHVLVNLKHMAKDHGEVMFVISQLNFGNYLNKPAYAAAAACLPRPRDLDAQHRRGDFDLLFIHRHLGVLIGEIKSVGIVGRSVEELEAVIAKRVDKAVKQLNKSEAVVRHLLKDLAPCVSIRKAVFLPYVSSQQFQKVLEKQPKLHEALRDSLGAPSNMAATDLCVCSDQLSDPQSYWHMQPDSLGRLNEWWQARMNEPCSSLTDDIYLDMVARFVGPATSVEVHCNLQPRVEVRTTGQAVSELGQRLCRLVLTSQQVQLLHYAPLRLCLAGPPGTGKTVMLVLMGMRWLREGCDVHVVSTRPDCLAASWVIQHQLELTACITQGDSSVPSVHFHSYDMYKCEADLDRAISDLKTVSQGRQLRVLMDEAKFTNSPTSPKLQRLVTELVETVPDLGLWAACLGNTDIPSELQPASSLTVPLRCAPAVHREVHDAIRTFKIDEYSGSGVASPGDGMDVIRLRHQGQGHDVRWPVDCAACGLAVAAELLRLGVGAEESKKLDGLVPLHYRDVLIVTRSSELHDIDETSSNTSTAASGIVQGLREAGLRVCVLEDIDCVTANNRARWERDVTNTALALTDSVTVAYHGAVSGLERKIVVWLRGRRLWHDDGASDSIVEARERLYVVSRCTTQLIVVDLPHQSQQ